MLRRKFDAEFKARVALEAIKEVKTVAEICSAYGVHSARICHWKKQALTGIKEAFGKRNGIEETETKTIEMLYTQIGQMKVENDFLKKTVYPH